jgi:dolichol-phosphate mannosyltransferase
MGFSKPGSDAPLVKSRGSGWISFVAACSIGAVANVGIAGVLFSQDVDWVLSALAGALVGSVWNYATTAVYTWKAR